MSDDIFNYVSFNDKIAAPEPQTVDESSRSFGEAVSDVAGNMIDTLANGGKILAIAGAGLQAGLNTEGFQQKKQQRTNAARMAELQLQQAEQNLQKSRFDLENAKKNAPLDTQIKEQNLLNAQQQGKNLALQYDQAQEARPHKAAILKAQAETAVLQAQKIQQGIWDNELNTAKNKGVENLKTMVNFPQLNAAGQYTFNNSQAVKAFVELNALFHAAQNNPEQLNYYISNFENAGWKRLPDEDGVPALLSPDGKIKFVANDAGLKKLTENIQQQLKDDLTAAKIIGTDSATLGQAVGKTVLNNPMVKKICGDDGTAYRVYSDYYNKKIINPKTGEIQDAFSPEQKMYHMLNISFGAALEDNMFNDEERATLLPQAQQMIKFLGGELKIGQDVDTTTVVWGRNQGYAQTYPIKDFLHTVLRDKDVITPGFGAHLQALVKKMKNNQLGGGSGNGENQNTLDDKLALSDMYRGKFGELSSEKQAELVAIKKAMDIESQHRATSRGAATPEQLSLDDLRELDSEWNAKVEKKDFDNKVFYSPYQDEIFLRERYDLYAQKAPLIKELRELEKTTSDYHEYKSGRRGPTERQKKLISLRGKINDINDKIKMREKKLSARGVAFKEYK